MSPPLQRFSFSYDNLRSIWPRASKLGMWVLVGTSFIDLVIFIFWDKVTNIDVQIRYQYCNFMYKLTQQIFEINTKSEKNSTFLSHICRNF